MTNLSSMLKFEFIKVRPTVPEIRIDFHGPLEPFTSFIDLTFTPEQSKTDKLENTRF